YDGGVKLVDFGIAKLAADPELSQRYALKGKLAYMSPEQLHNVPVDRRSDVFSLGIVLYEITTHSRLFKGATEVQTMKAVMACLGRGPLAGALKGSETSSPVVLVAERGNVAVENGATVPPPAPAAVAPPPAPTPTAATARPTPGGEPAAPLASPRAKRTAEPS